ncbi:hypothetical protein EXE30_04070 [Acinetobacter halotolerans]|uniref:Uncharacterized protein n=1 Tax=Acinetobacter halotolerans TaxID=1752076 RepID=A0A4Q6XC73_9GAMM|nr:hypothetical protein [Acinetobacter halotolerans]RZF55981.1 hypothetical protein EXE30_04070 [Acinetobacter halotolerans]
MQKILIVSILLTFSLNVIANVNFNADDELKELGIIGQDFEYIDLELATEFFKTGSEEAASSFPYKSNDVVEIVSAFMTPYYSSVTIRPLLEQSEEEEKEMIDFMRTEESLQEWCKELFKFNYMMVNDHQVELFYINKVGEEFGLVMLNNKTCR